jgi:pyruvate dehydrogenase E2 component (dihydrolipoyllysine-residue acetyltransferase)
MPNEILMPALSPTMEEGTLAKWMVKEGDVVEPGDILAEIETDKATMEFEAIDEGTVGRLLVSEGTEGVLVNTPIAILLEDGETAADIGEISAAPASAPIATAQVEAEASVAKIAATSQGVAVLSSTSFKEGRTKASPLARRMADLMNVDLGALSGSGPGGRIVKRDVEAATGKTGADVISLHPAAPSSSPALPTPTALDFSVYDPEDYDQLTIDGMRKIVARRLTESKQTVPHFYLTVDCTIDGLLQMRKDLNAKSPDGDGAFKISVNDFIIRASALALKKVPAANSSWAGDSILLHHHADISIAVAVEGGLITPVVRRAETKGLSEIANEMKDLGLRARARKLMPEEYQGGTFSISNLGMFGIREFSAVINPPQGAILAVGAGEQRPIVKDGALAIATQMTVTLSCDHRVVDGALGAELLAAFKGYIEDPVTMLL